MLRYLADPAPLLGLLVTVVVGFAGHNLAQAWTARLLGDRTAVRAGYGWPNPRRQLDWLGSIAAILTIFGWGFTAPVPVDVRGRRRGRAAASLLAGPVFLLGLTVGLSAAADVVEFDGGVLAPRGFVDELLVYAAICAGGLFVTSLIPIPPLGLGRALWLYAPTHGGWPAARYRLENEPLGQLIAFAVLMLPLLLGFLRPLDEIPVNLVAAISGAFHGR